MGTNCNTAFFIKKLVTAFESSSHYYMTNDVVIESNIVRRVLEDSTKRSETPNDVVIQDNIL
jgi:hypothetical protein